MMMIVAGGGGCDDLFHKSTDPFCRFLYLVRSFEYLPCDSLQGSDLNGNPRHAVVGSAVRNPAAC